MAAITPNDAARVKQRAARANQADSRHKSKRSATSWSANGTSTERSPPPTNQPSPRTQSRWLSSSAGCATSANRLE